MKKILSFIAFILLLSIYGQAQVERGRYLVGGNIDISEMLQGKNSGFNMALAPSFGVFVIKGLAIGAKYSFAITNTHNFSNSSHKYTNTTTFATGIGPTIKYYYGKKSLKGVVSANVNYLTSTTFRKTNSTSISGTSGFSAIGLLGMAYFFNPHISLESGLYLSGAGFEKQLPVTRIGFSVGLYAFLDKKKKE